MTASAAGVGRGGPVLTLATDVLNYGPDFRLWIAPRGQLPFLPSDIERRLKFEDQLMLKLVGCPPISPIKRQPRHPDRAVAGTLSDDSMTTQPCAQLRCRPNVQGLSIFIKDEVERTSTGDSKSINQIDRRKRGNVNVHHDHRAWSAGVGSGFRSSAQSSRYFMAPARDLKRRANRYSSTRARSSDSMFVVTICLSAGIATSDITIARMLSPFGIDSTDTIAYTVYRRTTCKEQS